MELSMKERVAIATGELIVAIGEGNFKDKVAQICYQFTSFGFENCEKLKEKNKEKKNAGKV